MQERLKYIRLKKVLVTIEKLERHHVNALALIVQLRDTVKREHDRLKQRNHYC